MSPAVTAVVTGVSGSPVPSTYAERGKKVTVVGLNEPSADTHRRLAGQLTGGH